MAAFKIRSRLGAKSGTGCCDLTDAEDEAATAGAAFNEGGDAAAGVLLIVSTNADLDAELADCRL
jgi:hypothetical protein